MKEKVCTIDSHILHNGVIWISWQPHYSVITDWQALLDSASDVYHSTLLPPILAAHFKGLEHVASPEITLGGSFGSRPIYCTCLKTQTTGHSTPLQVGSGNETAWFVTLHPPHLSSSSPDPLLLFRRSPLALPKTTHIIRALTPLNCWEVSLFFPVQRQKGHRRAFSTSSPAATEGTVAQIPPRLLPRFSPATALPSPPIPLFSRSLVARHPQLNDIFRHSSNPQRIGGSPCVESEAEWALCVWTPARRGKILHAADFGGLFPSSSTQAFPSLPQPLVGRGTAGGLCSFVFHTEHQGHFADTLINDDFSQKAAAWHVHGR